MCSFEFVKEDPEHLKRSEHICLDVDGTWRIPGCFATVLEKGKTVSEVSSFRQSFLRKTFHKAEPLPLDPPELYSYSGTVSSPRWKDLDPDNFTVVCHILADMSRIPAERLINPSGKAYYQMTFEVILLFGLIEMTAHIAWMDKGVENRSPATIVYDDEPSDRASILIKDFQRFSIAW
ncbi:hypothetical protein M413DRAFT_449922 [Hebeloma cylindrosporum]|uniref:Uncharacterized protein n=1 Tax=Hebeloma cylindrosporum TaxID=76867 RepID=A0A0C3BSJ1_HEBCY|nr:hypothetical protein M413DRAFT_449922 [Hebeloma cylindrosporum h7]